MSYYDNLDVNRQFQRWLTGKRYARRVSGTQERVSTLRERTRQAVRGQIAEAAMALFVANGYENTTIEQVAAEVGMSARSVFRYFPAKEDMVVGHLDQIGDTLAESLQARPADEDPWTALRQAMAVHLDALTADTANTLATAAMLADTPALRPALLNKRAHWIEALVPDTARRLPGSAADRDLAARAIVSSALACLNLAVDEWARTGGTQSVDTLLDDAIAAVRR